MTIEEKLIEMLINNGMDDVQAKQVMERVKAAKANAAMTQRWSDAVEDCPEDLFKPLWISTEDHALEWIDANLPLAWFRPMFASD